MDSELLSQLNEQQREAVEHTEGPLLILAGAGSGKTRVIAYRIAYLITEKHVAPWNILAVTFTNKASQEMRDRVKRLLSGQELSSAPWVSTFHSLCVRILRQDIEQLKEGFGRTFTIYDSDDSLRLIKNCIKDLGLDDKTLTPRSVQSAISAAKNRGEDVETFAARADYIDERRASIARVYKTYEERIHSSNALDFDDLLIKTVRLLRNVPEVRDKYNNKFRYVLVDEYQDTNSLQFALVSLLTQKQQNICVVGDEDQCLPGDTLITMGDKTKKRIADVRRGDTVQSCYGSGDFRPALVTERLKRNRKGEAIAITLCSGKRIVSTPEHTHFAGYRIGSVPQTYFTYLMRRNNTGWRLGTTQVYTAGQAMPMVGFAQRLLQERADALWVIGTHDNENEARADEYILSLKYQIPTLPFIARKGGSTNGLVHDPAYIAKVFNAFDMEASAERLLADRGLSLNHPHHRPRSRNSKRRNVVVTLCGDRRGLSPMHRISIVGNDSEGRTQLQALGFSVRPAKQGSASWRFETASADFGKISEFIERLRGAFEINVFMTARLGRNSNGNQLRNSLPFLPASSVLPGMNMFAEDGSYEVVKRVDRITIDEPVYDLNIERTHNFIANGIVTHNSIYKWRGADITNILNFEKHFKNARIIRLEQNYRSTQTILDVAGAVVKNNIERKGKTLWTSNPAGERVRYYQAFDAEAEARWVASKIVEHRKEDFNMRAAVLYRTNSQSRVFEEAMRRANLPYNIVGGFSFYERLEVRDIVAYLKLALNPDDSIALQRVINSPPRGIGKNTIEELERRAKDYGVSLWATIALVIEKPEGLSPRAVSALRNFRKIISTLAETAGVPLASRPTAGSADILSASLAGFESVEELAPVHFDPLDSDSLVSDLVKAAIINTGYELALKSERSDEADARLENLQELVNAAVDYDSMGANGLREFIDHSALVSDQDQYKSEVAVTLLTAHSAKGLEFPIVFIVGLEDGLFPHSRSATDAAELEEERRLCYVAITRAEKLLYVTHAMKRRVYGEELASEPSQFLNEMPLEMIEDLSLGKSWLSFARGSSTIEYNQGEYRRKERKPFAGKTYNSADSIAEFFKLRNQELGIKPKGQAAATKPSASAPSSGGGDFAPGSHVRHSKYGRGLVLRREGAGESTKLTVSFPGYGQKKLIQKFANLEKA